MLPYQHGFSLFTSTFFSLPPSLFMPYDKHKQSIWISKGIGDALPYIFIHITVSVRS
jgi:hypothetical protein